jgi:hypothetical protein
MSRDVTGPGARSQHHAPIPPTAGGSHGEAAIKEVLHLLKKSKYDIRADMKVDSCS